MFYISFTSTVLPYLISLLIIWIYLVFGIYSRIADSKEESKIRLIDKRNIKSEIHVIPQILSNNFDITNNKTDNYQNNSFYFNPNINIPFLYSCYRLKSDLYIYLSLHSDYLANFSSRGPPLT